MGGYRDWDDGDWPPARPRRVEGGIKARSRRGQIGESWWSGRFVAILESLGMGPRLGRGRAYARAGQVLDLGVTAGTVSARVQGSRARPLRRGGLGPGGVRPRRARPVQREAPGRGDAPPDRGGVLQLRPLPLP